jgi:hypothetical protein
MRPLKRSVTLAGLRPEMTKPQETRRSQYRVFKSKGSQTPAFSTNWKLLAEAYARYRCQNYGRIEKLVSGQYTTILEWGYAVRPSYN